MRNFMSSTVAVGALAVVTMAGCSSSPTTSTITGAVQQQTFPAPITGITVHSDKGDKVVPVDAAGKFELVLDKGAEYRFLFSPDGATLPLVARAQGGRLDTTVFVKAGGAKINVGTVAYFSGRATTNLTTAPTVATAEAPAVCEEQDDGEGDDNHECEDGLDPNGNPCDGGPAANQNDDAVEETDSQSTDEMALPEYNVPQEIGCVDDEEDDGEQDDD